MAWLLIIVAGLLEIGWMLGLKFSEGFTRLWPSVFTVACMAASMFLVSLALKQLPIGTAYAVWTGIGAAGAALVGILWFQESAAALRLASIALIIAGIIGLKISA